MKEGDGKLTDIRYDEEAGSDLGVSVYRQLSFRQHIGSKLKKVNRMIGLTRRTFHYMAPVYFIADTADCIWSPHLKVDIAQLENAGKRATRFC